MKPVGFSKTHLICLSYVVMNAIRKYNATLNVWSPMESLGLQVAFEQSSVLSTGGTPRGYARVLLTQIGRVRLEFRTLDSSKHKLPVRSGAQLRLFIPFVQTTPPTHCLLPEEKS